MSSMARSVISSQSISQMRVTELAAGFGLALVSLCLFRPAYLGSFEGLFAALEDMVTIALALYVIVRHRWPNRFVVAVWVYCAVVVISALLSGNLERWSATFYLRISLYAYYFQMQLSDHPSRVYTITFGILLVFCVMDAASVALFPSGLYDDVRVENEYYTTTLHGWLFGLKNNHVLWFLSLVFLSAAKDRWSRGVNELSARTIACLLLSLIVTVSLGSSTSTVTLMFTALLLIIGSRSQSVRRRLTPFTVCMVLLVAWVFLILFSGFGVLNGVIETLFNKDATFSGRNLAWAETLEMIGKSPLIGYGLQSTEERTLLLGSVEYVNSHNQILESLYIGGILALMAMCGLLASLLHSNSRGKEVADSYFAALILLAVGLEMLFEVVAGSPVFWFLLLMAYMGSRRADAGCEK